MIGLLDLDGDDLVGSALERSGQSLLRLTSHSRAREELRTGRVHGLIVETVALGADAVEVVRSARAHGVPSLVVARDRSVSTAVDALRQGASDYLATPFEYDSLLDALDRLKGACSAVDLFNEDPVAIVTQDAKLLETLELVRSVAISDATVLIEGESGTGKELLARLVHSSSPRRHRDLISINCAALPPGLLESELFGHEKGAFTGAFTRVIGKFELAHGTTILLDEIGELELGLQAKLLRVLQEKQIQRVGARQPIDVDFRLVATTNRDLAAEVRAGRFREDLFYRLNVLPVHISPLRERFGDVRALVPHFLRRFQGDGGRAPVFPEETLAVLERHSWPGNARELENLIERLVLTRPGQVVRPEDLALHAPIRSDVERHGDGAPPFRTIREMERWLMVHTLRRLEGNRTRTARELGISLRTLRNKINEYEITEPDTLPRSGTAAASRLRSAALESRDVREGGLCPPVARYDG
jgi:two-component system response regulator FlrC